MSELPGPGRYQRLDPSMLLATLDRLRDRIAERFPERNLVHVATEVRQVVADLADRTEQERGRERLVGALATGAVVVVTVLATLTLGVAVRDALREAEGTRAFEWLPILESAINDAVFAGVAIFFLVTVPARQQRKRLLAALHRLRSLAHVIDMHQLTKDPERVRADFPATAHSPQVGLSADELGRYLDYCSELLALVGKGAALCAQASTDAVVLDTVSEIETLTLGMARKVWQKISLLQAAR